MRPAVVVHHGPEVEFYDETTLFDSLAAIYHRTRGYFEGYFPALFHLESEKTHRNLGGFSTPIRTLLDLFGGMASSLATLCSTSWR